MLALVSELKIFGTSTTFGSTNDDLLIAEKYFLGY